LTAPTGTDHQRVLAFRGGRDLAETQGLADPRVALVDGLEQRHQHHDRDEDQPTALAELGDQLDHRGGGREQRAEAVEHRPPLPARAALLPPVPNHADSEYVEYRMFPGLLTRTWIDRSVGWFQDVWCRDALAVS
jgi:hypothetical protein